MAFFDKLNDLAKNIGDKTNDAIETGKLNSKINSENAAAMEEIKKIGTYYYNLFAADAGNSLIVPEVLEFCQNAKAHYDAAAEAQATIEQIKAENEAAKAQAAVTATEQPAMTEVVESVEEIPARATVVSETVAASVAEPVATPMQEPVVVAPARRFCTACGCEVSPEVKFCPSCGQKLV